MQTQITFCDCFMKMILNFFSDEPNLPLIPKVRPSPSTKKLFLRLSAWNEKLLSTPKIITFLNLNLLVRFLGQASKS